MTTTLVRPLDNDQRSRLVARLGRDYYVYNGKPEKDTHLCLSGETELIWRFKYPLFEDGFRNILISDLVFITGASPKEVEAVLRHRRMYAIPRDKIVLEYR